MNKILAVSVFSMLLASQVFAIHPYYTTTLSDYSNLSVKPPRTKSPFRHSGIFSLTEANLAFGLGNTEKPYSERFFGINTILGYQFSSTFFTGAGAGMCDYTSGTMLPAFITARYYFNKINHIPFIAADAGWLHHVWGIEVNKRPFLNPSVGICEEVGKGITLTAAIGLFTQWDKDTGQDSFLTFKFGLLFF